MQSIAIAALRSSSPAASRRSTWRTPTSPRCLVLVISGVITPDDAADLTAIGTVPASLAEILFGAGTAVTQADVSYSLRSLR